MAIYICPKNTHKTPKRNVLFLGNIFSVLSCQVGWSQAAKVELAELLAEADEALSKGLEVSDQVASRPRVKIDFKKTKIWRITMTVLYWWRLLIQQPT